MTYYFKSKGFDTIEHTQRIFGYFFSVIYIFLQVYIVLTAGQPLDWFFSAAGFAMCSYTAGIKISDYLPTRK